ncbi:acyl-CoA dehydrogenase family protein [candidate division WOR-3 bacterium]|nr:acyl-CoA dehydrogenase family protein [candidate division WOR-3 bacterium]
MLKSELKKFAQQVILDKVDELDKACTFPVDHIKQLADMGILGALVPEEYDGAGLDLIGFVVSLEEMSKVCASLATVIAAHNAFFVYPILKYGNDGLKKKYLPAAVTGEIIGGFACTGTHETKVEKSGAGCTINGTNPFVLNAAANGPFTAFLPKSEGSVLACVIDRDAHIEQDDTNSVLGLKSAGIHRVSFKDFTLPEHNVLSTPAQGNAIQNETLTIASISLAAVLVGIAQGACDEAIKYAKERVQFAQPIISFGMVREKIALMATRIEASRQLVYNAAMLCDAGKKVQPSASIARYFAGETAVEVTDEAIQIFGGYGYMKDYPVERYFRDAQTVNVIGGTPAMHKELIAQETIG